MLRLFFMRKTQKINSFIMFTKISTNKKYPKTLVIRNTVGGMIWQLYHVETEREAERLSIQATKNGFQGITLEDYQPKEKQTWPDWRETKGGQKIIND